MKPHTQRRSSPKGIYDCRAETGNIEGNVRPDIQQFLKDARDFKPDTLERMYDSFLRWIDDLRDQGLAPGPYRTYLKAKMTQPRANNQQVEEPPPTSAELFNTLIESWNELDDNLMIAATHVWRDFFQQFRPEPHGGPLQVATTHKIARTALSQKSMKGMGDRLRLVVRTRLARALLLLRMEVRLYKLRIESNFIFYEENQRENPVENTVKSLKTILDAYTIQLAKWRREMQKTVGIAHFHAQIADSVRFKMLSEEFGSNHKSDDELGWIGQAGRVGDELSYQYFDAQLHEKRQHPRTWPRALWLWIMRWSIGFGVRPGRFVATFFASVGIFFAGYAINDAVITSANNPYPIVLTWPGILTTVGQHLMLAVANLTPIGYTPKPLGLGGQILLVIEPLIAYFFLAILAALLMEQLKSAED